MLVFATGSWIFHLHLFSPLRYNRLLVHCTQRRAKSMLYEPLQWQSRMMEITHTLQWSSTLRSHTYSILQEQNLILRSIGVDKEEFDLMIVSDLASWEKDAHRTEVNIKVIAEAFDFDFTKKQPYHLDSQQLNTTINHIHYPISYTLELVTWMCRWWDTSIKRIAKFWNVISQLPLLLPMDLHATTAMHHHLYSHS